MATITNTEKRLLVGPAIPGHKSARWLPGRNPLDPGYWKAAKEHSTIKRWLRERMISVDLDDEMPDPNEPPDAKALGEFTKRELERALKDPAVPVQWHPALEAELAKRRDEEVRSRLAPNPSGGDRKTLKGIKVDDALPLIAAETDVDVLSAWADADERKSIEEAIDSRLTELALGENDEG